MQPFFPSSTEQHRESLFKIELETKSPGPDVAERLILHRGKRRVKLPIKTRGECLFCKGKNSQNISLPCKNNSRLNWIPHWVIVWRWRAKGNGMDFGASGYDWLVSYLDKTMALRSLWPRDISDSITPDVPLADSNKVILTCLPFDVNTMVLFIRWQLKQCLWLDAKTTLCCTRKRGEGTTFSEGGWTATRRLSVLFSGNLSGLMFNPISYKAATATTKWSKFSVVLPPGVGACAGCTAQSKPWPYFRPKYMILNEHVPCQNHTLFQTKKAKPYPISD